MNTIKLPKIGVAKIDITPDYPIRLSGYGARKTETTSVVQPIWARCLVIIPPNQQPFILLCVENCGIPEHITETVAQRLKVEENIPRRHFTLSVTHTHSAPFVSGALETLFGQSIPVDHQARIDRYTVELTDKLVLVVQLALSKVEIGQLSWGLSSVDFARNRRDKRGPVDHDLPVMLASRKNGEPMAIWCSYACHTTTVAFNTINGDWAGYAMSELEAEHPTAMAFVSIGCAGDANPYPRGEYEHAKQHGHSVAEEVSRLMKTKLKPLNLDTTRGEISWVKLPFDEIPTRTEWEKRVKEGGAVGYHAEVQLAKIDSGQTLPSYLSYAVQVWQFGQDLSIVFLAGEVVVDFALRLKNELGKDTLWISAYCNDLPAYIPSVRILKEGGYEGKTAMIYFNRPTHFKPDVEELVISAVHGLLS